MIPGSLVSSFRVVSHTVATPAPRCVLDSQSTSVVRRPLWRHGGPRERPRVRAAAADWQSSDDFNKLHSELNRAVDAEDYAQAASIRDEIKKKMVESGIDEGPTDWREMGLLSWLIDRTEQLGFKIPTPIQRRVIPEIMRERDILMQAVTGSGKTLAFLLPTLSLLDYEVARDDIESPGLLIVVPTRELGVQIVMLCFKLFGGNVSKGIPGDPGNIFRFNGPRELKVLGILDAHEAVMARDPRYLRGVHVVVATPWALNLALSESVQRSDLEKSLRMDDDPELKEEVIQMGLRSKPSWVMNRLERVVVDEVDACFDRFPRETMTALSKSQSGRLVKPQLILCGATLSHKVASLAATTGALKDPALIGIEGGRRLPASTRHAYMRVPAPVKLVALARMLKKDLEDQSMDDAPPRAMVFAGSEEEARQIADPLRTSLWGQHRLSVLLPTGFETVRQMEEFRDNRSSLMVCTPTSARGIDMPAVTHVYLCRSPNHPDEYVHAAGRVGRVGARVDGEVVTLVAEGPEEEAYLAMVRSLGIEPERWDPPGDPTQGLDPEKEGDLDALRKAMEDVFALSEGQDLDGPTK